MNLQKLITELEEQLEKISPWPWYISDCVELGNNVYSPGKIFVCCTDLKNQNFVASAPQNIAALITVLKEALEVIEFYGRKNNWTRHNGSSPDAKYIFMPSVRALEDGYVKAKQFLEKWGGK